MPVKYFEDQMDDEDVQYVFRKHPVVMRKGLLLSSFGLLVGPIITLVLVYARPDSPPSLNFFYLNMLGSLLLAAVLFIPAFIAWYFSVFIVTDQRLIQITQKGMFHRSVVDLGLSQIQMVNYEVSGLQETVLGFGTIMIQTFMGDLTIHDVHHPARTQKKLLTILREQGVTASAGQLNVDDQHESR